MPLAVDVVKRKGKRPTESFTRSKLHASIVAACLSVRSPEGVAGITADKVCDAVIIWLGDKPEITSDDLRIRASRSLEAYHPEAAFLYKQYQKLI